MSLQSDGVRHNLLPWQGDLWMLYMPSELAYGDDGIEGEIPGGAAVTFELEMVKFGSKQAI